MCSKFQQKVKTCYMFSKTCYMFPPLPPIGGHKNFFASQPHLISIFQPKTITEIKYLMVQLRKNFLLGYGMGVHAPFKIKINPLSKRNSLGSSSEEPNPRSSTLKKPKEQIKRNSRSGSAATPQSSWILMV